MSGENDWYRGHDPLLAKKWEPTAYLLVKRVDDKNIIHQLFNECVDGVETGKKEWRPIPVDWE